MSAPHDLTAIKDEQDLIELMLVLNQVDTLRALVTSRLPVSATRRRALEHLDHATKLLIVAVADHGIEAVTS